MHQEQIEPMEIINGIVNLINDRSIRSQIVYIGSKGLVSMKCNQCAYEERRIYFFGNETTVEWKPMYFCRYETVEDDFLVYINYNIYIQFHRMTKEAFFEQVTKSKIVEQEFHFNYEKKTIAEQIYFDFLFGQNGKKYHIETKIATKEQYWKALNQIFHPEVERKNKETIVSFVFDNMKVKAKGIQFDTTLLPGKRVPILWNKDFELALYEDFAKRFFMNQFAEFGLFHTIYCEDKNQLEIVFGDRWFFDLYGIEREEADYCKQIFDKEESEDNS